MYGWMLRETQVCQNGDGEENKEVAPPSPQCRLRSKGEDGTYTVIGTRAYV